MKPLPVEQRLLDRRRIDPQTGCWEYTRYIDSNGYGQMGVNGKVRRVHVIAYELWIGPIPKGKQVNHRCNNPSCFNPDPDHLYAGTQGKNIEDTVAAGNHLWASKTHCPHGHEYTPDNTFVYRGHRICKACKAEYQRQYRKR